MISNRRMPGSANASVNGCAPFETYASTRCVSASSPDEAVFTDPFAFRVDRRPNPHLAFGFGEHFCVGAHLARTEIDVILRHLLVRYDWFELAGPVERLESIVNGSIKRLPLRPA